MPKRIRTTRIVLHTQSLAREIDRMQFSDYLGDPSAWTPNVDAFRYGDRIELRVELADVRRDDIELAVQPRRLILQGVRRKPDTCAGAGDAACRRILAMEIPCGVFRREVRLPVDVDPERVTARQDNGILCIILPFAPPETEAP